MTAEHHRVSSNISYVVFTTIQELARLLLPDKFWTSKTVACRSSSNVFSMGEHPQFKT
jgi:hypothetical protein